MAMYICNRQGTTVFGLASQRGSDRNWGASGLAAFGSPLCAATTEVGC